MNEGLGWEVEKIASDMRIKYVYFLLAAVGACVGFAITQSKDSMFVYWSLPLGAAVLSWAVSFVFGCIYIHRKLSFFDHRLLISTIAEENKKLMANVDKYPVNYIRHQREALEDLKFKVDLMNEESKVFYQTQFLAFSLGAFFYIVWHIVEMWRRTPENMCLWV